MSNGVVLKAQFSNNLQNKPGFQAVRSPTESISSGVSSPSPTSRSTSPACLLSSPIDPLVPVKLQVQAPTLAVDQLAASETLPAVPKSVGKVEMAVKILPFKGLQNGIENPTELLQKLN